jgi:hypothetical protein
MKETKIYQDPIRIIGSQKKKKCTNAPAIQQGFHKPMAFIRDTRSYCWAPPV